MRILDVLLSVSSIRVLLSCPDNEFGASCVKQCHAEMTDCWRSCDGDDYECSVQGDKCVQSCPCFSQCPNGCDGCANSICVCARPDEDPDYVTCAAWVKSVYNECFTRCTPGNVDCVSECARNFNAMISQCPCQAECPSGCPCEAYQCPSTTGQLVTSTIRSTTSAPTKTWTTVCLFLENLFFGIINLFNF